MPSTRRGTQNRAARSHGPLPTPAGTRPDPRTGGRGRSGHRPTAGQERIPPHERGRDDRRPRHRGTRVTVAGHLIDTSALARVLLRQNTAQWDDTIAADLVAICDLTEPEDLYSARSTTDRTRVKAALDAHYPWCPMPDGVYRRSRITQEQLTTKGEHRSAGPMNLLMAAATEEAGLPHHDDRDDRDFETIARTIDLKQQSPRGTDEHRASDRPGRLAVSPLRPGPSPDTQRSPDDTTSGPSRPASVQNPTSRRSHNPPTTPSSSRGLTHLRRSK